MRRAISLKRDSPLVTFNNSLLQQAHADLTFNLPYRSVPQPATAAAATRPGGAPPFGRGEVGPAHGLESLSRHLAEQLEVDVTVLAPVGREREASFYGRSHLS